MGEATAKGTFPVLAGNVEKIREESAGEVEGAAAGISRRKLRGGVCAIPDGPLRVGPLWKAARECPTDIVIIAWVTPAPNE